MPLSVAAAIAFHQAQGGRKAIQSPEDYISALDMAAAALSRLIPIYVFDESLHTRVAIRATLVEGQFRSGAIEFRYHGGLMLTPLSVVRGDLTSALSLMRRVGPTLAFAIAAGVASVVIACHEMPVP